MRLPGQQAPDADIRAPSGEVRGDLPTRCPLAESLPDLPGVLLHRLQLGTVQSGIHLSRAPGIDIVEALCYRLSTLRSQKLRERSGVQLTSRYFKAMGCCIRHSEQLVRHRDRSLHTHSITRVIPALRCGKPYCAYNIFRRVNGAWRISRHPRPVGKTFPGFKSCAGSNRALNRAM
jgi:hypothetical protein